jgi:hypothetical protein
MPSSKLKAEINQLKIQLYTTTSTYIFIVTFKLFPACLSTESSLSFLIRGEPNESALIYLVKLV